MTDFKEQLGVTFPAGIGQLPKRAVGAIKTSV